LKKFQNINFNQKIGYFEETKFSLKNIKKVWTIFFCLKNVIFWTKFCFHRKIWNFGQKHFLWKIWNFEQKIFSGAKIKFWPNKYYLWKILKSLNKIFVCLIFWTKKFFQRKIWNFETNISSEKKIKFWAKIFSLKNIKCWTLFGVIKCRILGSSFLRTRLGKNIFILKFWIFRKKTDLFAWAFLVHDTHAFFLHSFSPFDFIFIFDFSPFTNYFADVLYQRFVVINFRKFLKKKFYKKNLEK